MYSHVASFSSMGSNSPQIMPYRQRHVVILVTSILYNPILFSYSTSSLRLKYQSFTNCAISRPTKTNRIPNGKPSGKLPSLRLAKKISVGTLYSARHNVMAWTARNGLDSCSLSLLSEKQPPQLPWRATYTRSVSRSVLVLGRQADPN